MTLVTIPYKPLPGEVRNITQITANFEEFLKVINGELDGEHNIAANAIKTTNIENLAVTEGKLSVAVQASLNTKASGLEVQQHASNAEAKYGEFFVALGALTVTLPTKPGNSSQIGVYNISKASLVKVKVEGSTGIIGDFISTGKEVVLGPGQHVVFMGLGEETDWLITSGEPKRKEEWGTHAYTKGETIVLNEFRDTQVNAKILGELNEKIIAQVSVNGHLAGEAEIPAETGLHSTATISVLVPAGQTIKVTGGTVTLYTLTR